jgi:hypothetical protein
VVTIASGACQPPPLEPYVVDGWTGEVGQRAQVGTELGPDLDLFLDTAVIDDASARRARRALTEALAALDAGQAGWAWAGSDLIGVGNDLLLAGALPQARRWL